MSCFWQSIFLKSKAQTSYTKPNPTIWHVAAEQAKQEWLYAHMFYDNLLDKDLMDYAIYMILASEKKYMYILKKIKEGGEAHSSQ